MFFLEIRVIFVSPLNNQLCNPIVKLCFYSSNKTVVYRVIQGGRI